MRRTGCRNHATYRIVAADERSPRDGKFLEILGWYDTQIKDNNFQIDLEKVDKWLKNGAIIEGATGRTLEATYGEGGTTDTYQCISHYALFGYGASEVARIENLPSGTVMFLR